MRSERGHWSCMAYIEEEGKSAGADSADRLDIVHSRCTPPREAALGSDTQSGETALGTQRKMAAASAERERANLLGS